MAGLPPPALDVGDEDGGAPAADGADAYDDEATAAAAFHADTATAAAAGGVGYDHEAYRAAHTASLLEVRTRQLRALQQDYLRLHEHTLQQAQLHAEQQNAAHQKTHRAEVERERMREQLQSVRTRSGEAKPMVLQALAGCEKMLARLAAVRSVDQLPGEMAAASAMLFEARTSLLQAEGALREPEAPLPPTDGPAASARSKFNEADLNHDRKLDKREFRQLLKKEFGSADPKAADQLFASIDADGSGDIDYAEFKKGVAKGRLGAISVKDFGGGARNGGADGGSGRRAGAPGGGVPAARGGQSRIPGPSASKRVAGGASDPARSRSASRGSALPAVRPPPSKAGAAAASGGSAMPPQPVGYALASGGAVHPAPLPAGAALHAASAMPAAYQQLQPAYHQQMAQQYQQMHQAQLQHALAQQRQQPIPGFGLGLPVWAQGQPLQ